ncbi:MAG TPA: VOC family protein [Cyclobacteriaceae bacterium]|nr:VOC family protein [Cyclobacteriaceae bacterium]
MVRRIAIAFLILMVGSVGVLYAQGKSTVSLNHVALSVKNVGTSAEFYKSVLGLEEITNRTKNPERRWLSLGDGKELHLISGVPGNVTTTKAVHLGLTCSNFESFVKTLEKNKVTYSDWPGAVNTISTRADGVKQVYFQDPDGYWIEVNNVSAQ